MKSKGCKGKTVKVEFYDGTESIFNSLQDAAEAYGMKSPNLSNMIQMGKVSFRLQHLYNIKSIKYTTV